MLTCLAVGTVSHARMLTWLPPRGGLQVNRPIYTSSIKTGKHTDPVWQVHWQKEDFAKVRRPWLDS